MEMQKKSRGRGPVGGGGGGGSVVVNEELKLL